MDLDAVQQLKAKVGETLNNRATLLFTFGILILSLPQLILTPPFQVPDAFAHFIKAEALAEGHLFPTMIAHAAGSTMPASIAALVDLFARLPFHPAIHYSGHLLRTAASLTWNARPLFTTYTPASFDPPFLYIPTVIGLLIGSLIHLTLLRTYYLAELIMLLSATLLLSIAFSLTPRHGRPLVAVVAFLPMATSLYSSVSRDALILPLILLAVATRIRWADVIIDRHFRKSAYWFPVIALLPVAMTKPPYWLLIPLLYLPFERLLPKPRQLLRPILLPAATSLAIVGLWYAAVANQLSVTFVSGAGISVAGQIRWLMTHPLGDISVIYHTFRANGTFYYESTVGILGWLDTPLPHWIYPVFALCILLAMGPLLASLTRRSETWSPFIVAVLTGVLLFLGVEVALYATWTPVGAPIVLGVQGRYLLPILPLVGLLGRNPEGHGGIPVLINRLAVFAVSCEVVLSLVVIPATLISRFWV